MKILFIFISLVATINCQAADPGFRLDALKILNTSGGNTETPAPQNTGLPTGLNNGLSNPNGMMGMILGGNNQLNQLNNNNQMPQMMASSSSNSFPNLPQMPQMPRFSDGLNYQTQNPIPVPYAADATLGDYKPEDPRDRALTAPGRYAPITNVPQLDLLVERPVYGSSSRTASLKNDPRANNPDWKQFLFDFQVPTNPGVMPSMNMGADDTIDRYLAGIGIPNQSQFKNGLFQNRNTSPASPQQNNANLNNGLYNNGQYNNGQYNSGLYNSNLNNGLNNGLSNGLNDLGNGGLSLSGSNLVPSTAAYGQPNDLPIEVSQYSTKIVHDLPQKLGLSQPTGPYQIKPAGF